MLHIEAQIIPEVWGSCGGCSRSWTKGGHSENSKHLRYVWGGNPAPTERNTTKALETTFECK